MQGGNLLAVAEVFKTLLILQKEKPLSFREKKMLDCARHMLITEISISRSVRDTEAIELLQKALAKSSLEFPAAL
jgi:CarD family transcriptional regulator